MALQWKLPANLAVCLFLTQRNERIDPAQEACTFHGYYFNPMTAGHGNASNKFGATPVFVAYPAEYCSSGVMTFVVTAGDVIFDRISGAALQAKVLSFGSLDSSWHLVEWRARCYPSQGRNGNLEFGGSHEPEHNLRNLCRNG
jgi:hypothetical protein